VSVWRDGNGWVGPHQFLDRVRGTSFVLLGKERRPFPSTKVKPYPTLNEDNGEDIDDPHTHPRLTLLREIISYRKHFW
jgi:hypothetical protein